MYICSHVPTMQVIYLFTRTILIPEIVNKSPETKNFTIKPQKFLTKPNENESTHETAKNNKQLNNKDHSSPLMPWFPEPNMLADI